MRPASPVTIPIAANAMAVTPGKKILSSVVRHRDVQPAYIRLDDTREPARTKCCRRSSTERRSASSSSDGGARGQARATGRQSSARDRDAARG